MTANRFTVPGPARRTVHPGLLSVADLTSAEFARLVSRSVEFHVDRDAHDSPLRGQVFGTLFTKTSTRTRTAFSTAALRLGGRVLAYGPNELQTATGETWEDTARVLGAMLDGLVARTAGPLADLRSFARHSAIPVVNAMTAEEHPTQAVCDVATLAANVGGADPRGTRLLYVGEGNNTATALAAAMALVPDSDAVFATPPGYGLPPGWLEAAARRGADVGARLRETHDMTEAIELCGPDVAVVYTTRWQTTGTTKPDPDWRSVFAPFTVSARLMTNWPDAVLMHDLPAHRGEEVAAEVLDGPRSLAWDQARMKLSSAMAVLEWVAGS